MKYKLTDESIVYNGKVLYRIECVTTFADVKAGDKGGWVESYDNLSQYGTSWVYDNAKVYGNAKVYDQAQVRGNAVVHGGAVVHGNASVFDNARVHGMAHVYGNALIYNDAHVHGMAHVLGSAWVREHAAIHGSATVSGQATIRGYAEVYGYARIVSTTVCGCAMIHGDAIITKPEDYIVFQNNFSSLRFFTWTRSNDKWSVGCFHGTGKELIKKAYADGTRKGKCYEAYVELVEKLKLINTDN